MFVSEAGKNLKIGKRFHYFIASSYSKDLHIIPSASRLHNVYSDNRNMSDIFLRWRGRGAKARELMVL